MYKLSFLYLLIALNSFSQTKGDLIIDFNGLKDSNGKLFIALYNNKNDFLKKEIEGVIVEVKNGKATAIFNKLPYGEYAVSSFYDKNNNGKLDTNFLGIPKEPYNFSNNAKGILGAPKFKDVKFSIASSKKIIEIKY